MSEWMVPSFAYEKKEDGAAILRCFSRDGTVQIPEQIDGLPVRELGAYAFSAHMNPDALKDAGLIMPADRANVFGADLREREALCGDAVEEIILPETINRVGRYCFYNCGHLRRLEFPGTLADWGSGAFTGCHRVKELCVHADPEEETGLKQILDELPEELRVEFRRDAQKNPAKSGAYEGCAMPETISDGGSELSAVLSFPEFYEEGVENTPARILETHVHGSGIRYRNCFQGKRFDFTLYDSLFPYAQAQENTLLLTKLVLGRLRFPCRLGEQERMRYEAYVRGNLKTFGMHFLDQRDLGGLQWFLEHFAEGKESLLDGLSEYALRRGDAAAISLLMEFRRRTVQRPAGRRKLELI